MRLISKLTCIFLLTLETVVFTAASSKILFDEANNYALQGDFDQACRLYNQIQDKTSMVWHNLGNCQYAQKQYVQALISWKRAESGAGFWQLGDLFELEQKVLKVLDVPVPIWWKYELFRLIMMLPIVGLQCLLLVLLGLLFFLMFARLRGKKNWMEKYCILIFLLGVVCSILWLSHSHIIEKTRAFVVKKSVIVYAGPEKFFHEISTLPLATEVEVIKNEQHMSQITLSHGYHGTSKDGKLCGWVDSNFIEVV